MCEIVAVARGDDAVRVRMGRDSRGIAAEHAIDATLDTFEANYYQLVTGSRVGLRRAA